MGKLACAICDASWDPIQTPPVSPVPPGWPHQQSVIEQHRDALHNVVLQRDFVPPETLAGDGIVLVCRGEKFAAMTIHTIHMIRFGGCTTPIQLWTDCASLLAYSWDATTSVVDMDEFLKEHPLRIPGGWEWKCHAMLHSGFARVLYLDVDCYPVQDPTPLFALLDTKPFIFWEDLHCCQANIHWQIFGLQKPNNGITFQGGVGFFDMKACWRMLNVYAWLNWHSDWTYSHGFGDQDACLVATIATKLPYRSLGLSRWVSCAFSYMHRGLPWFVHRCRSKLVIGALPPRCHRLPLEEQVFDLWSCIDEGYLERVDDAERAKTEIDPRKIRRAILAKRGL